MLGTYTIINNNIEIISQIKKELIACIPNEYNDNITYPIFREDSDKLYLPRYYKNKNIDIIRNYNQGLKCKFKFVKELRSTQKEIIDVCIDKINKYNGGIINLPCGYGKTIIALYIASLLQLKTLVVVHKTFLQDQWIDRIHEFTNAKVGIIKQQKIDIDNKDIVVGMLQSISMIDYDNNIFNDFGLVIYDEAHHIVAKVFSNALYKINAKYIIGLTATVNTQGNLFKCSTLHLGKIIYKIEKTNNLAKVKVFNYKSNDKLFTEKRICIKGNIKPNIQKMINNICSINNRNKLLVDIIYNLWNIEDRKILVLSGRINKVQHLQQIKQLLEDKIDNEINNGKLMQNECNIYYYTGNTTQFERSQAEKYADIILATYDMAHEGLDIPRLNTVILTTPKTSIKQAIGRIMRKCDNDIVPLIIDFVDLLSSFPNQYKRRERVYKQLKYDIDIYYAQDDKIITKSNYLINTYKYTEEDLKQEFDETNPDYEPNLEKILLT